jgi:hypothetical protein
MKRFICILLAAMMCGMVFFPVGAYATAFSVSGTDMTIDVDDSQWYVFTRDNIKDNPELDELGLSYDEMNDILLDNHAYMDAILFYGDGNFVELFVRKKSVDSGMANLSNYDDDDVQELTKELAKWQNGGTSWDELVDEIADVTIMMEQLRLIFGMGAAVRSRMNYKVQRLLCRLHDAQVEEDRRGYHAETQRSV